MNTTHLKKLLLSSALLLLGSACGEAQPPVAISDAWVRSPVPGQTTGVAYLSLQNNSDNAITLTAVSSPVARSAEIHEHRHDNGTMRMRRLPTLTIDAGQSAQFKPGGLHMMLFGMNAEPPAATRLILRADDGREFATDAEIRRP